MILVTDFLIFVIFLLIPAGIVHQMEPCMPFSESLWYVFATITTIGFGDVIAGFDSTFYCQSVEIIQDDFYHQNNAFWVISIFFFKARFTI